MIKQSSDITFQTKVFYWGEVVKIVDNTLSGKILVRVANLDKNIADADLPPCYPLFNFQFHHVLPKVGERVAVFPDRTYADSNVNQEKRYWSAIGISQPHNIDYDPYYFTGGSNESDGFVKPVAISQLPQARGINPKDDEIAHRGRVNTDILFKDNQVLVRAGRHLPNRPLEFNEMDPAYIQVRFRESTPLGISSKTQEELVEVPSEYIIKVTTIDSSATIKVILKSTGESVDSFSSTYTSDNQMIAGVRSTILGFQAQYPRWELRTILDDLSDMPLMYPNNKKLVRRQVSQKTEARDSPSTINIVADRINLLSHSTNEYDLTDPDSVISPEEMDKILENGYKLVKGDTLVEVLELMRRIALNHVHPYPNMETVKESDVLKLANYDFQTLLNPNIRLA